MVALNSKKTQLRSNEIEQSSIKQKLTELDVEVGKLTIANQYLSSEDDELTAKNDEFLYQKNELLKELKEWKEAKDSLRTEVGKGDEENREKKKYIESLLQRGEELKAKIKVKEGEKKEVYDYNLDLEIAIETSDC
jgi:chromosome segregation ATPase